MMRRAGVNRSIDSSNDANVIEILNRLSMSMRQGDANRSIDSANAANSIEILNRLGMSMRRHHSVRDRFNGRQKRHASIKLYRDTQSVNRQPARRR